MRSIRILPLPLGAGCGQEGGLHRQLELAGWLLWLVGVGFFTVSGLRSGDVWTVIGSVLFGIGIVCLLIPMMRRKGG